MQRSPPAISKRNFNFSQLYTGLRRVSPAQIFLGKRPEWCHFFTEKQLPGFRSSPIGAFPQFCLPLWWRRQLCDTVNASNTFLTWANTAILICFLSTFLSWNSHRLTGICRKGVQEAPYTLHPPPATSAPHRSRLKHWHYDAGIGTIHRADRVFTRYTLMHAHVGGSIF